MLSVRLFNLLEMYVAGMGIFIFVFDIAGHVLA